MIVVILENELAELFNSDGSACKGLVVIESNALSGRLVSRKRLEQSYDRCVVLHAENYQLNDHRVIARNTYAVRMFSGKGYLAALRHSSRLSNHDFKRR